MKKQVIIWILLLTFAGVGSLAAQYDDEVVDTALVDKKPEVRERKSFDMKNIFIGMTYRFAFGQVLLLDVAPYVGYRLFDRIALGVGVPYMYYYSPSSQQSTHIYGVRGFMRLRPITQGFASNFYIHTELEQLNLSLANPNYNPNIPNSGNPRFLRSSATAANLGLGYTNTFTKGIAMTIELLYNALYVQGQSIFNTPFVYRFGVYYGF
jgi:hypothetical protein